MTSEIQSDSGVRVGEMDSGDAGLFPRLFEPIQVGPMLVANRICETTNTIGAGRSTGLPDQPFVEHHLAKARGGTAWIGNETWLLDEPLPASAADEFFPGVGAMRFPLYLLPGFVDGVAGFVDQLHAAGAVGVFQLTHLNYTMAASSVPLVEPCDWVPHSIDEDEIERLLQTYVTAAGQFLAAGADGVEIHCAHETLPHTFLSPALNKRDDRWGGDPVSRTLFVTELLRRVRERIGHSMALGIRVSGEEHRHGGYTHMEMREMITHIADVSELDFVNVDVGHSWGAPSYVQPSYYDHAQFREVGRAIRADVAPVPVLFSGRVNDPVVAEQLLEAGVCDLVGMTRAGIADPDFANKAREGRLSEIRRCIGCNRCIANSIDTSAPQMFRKPVCSVNPQVGREIEWASGFRKVKQPRRVVVIGAGAAGLEAARVASLRGHDVVLLEAAPAIGGQLRLASRAPGRDSFEDYLIWHSNQVEMLGLDLRLSSPVGVSEVLAMDPDAVVCATGSRPRSPDGWRVEKADPGFVVQGWDVLAGSAEVGERVLIVSEEDHFETPNIAEYLALGGAEVTIAHKWLGVGSQIDRYSIGPVVRRLAAHRVETKTGLRLENVDGRSVFLKSAFDGHIQQVDGFDKVVLVLGSVPDTAVHDQLKAAGGLSKLLLAGSAWVPRLLAEATQHGAQAGMEV